MSSLFSDVGCAGRKSGPEQTRILPGFTDGACGGAYGGPRHYFFSAETFRLRWVFLTTYCDIYLVCDVGLGCCTLCGLYVYVLSIRVTSHYFASVALSVRGWVDAWPESSGRFIGVVMNNVKQNGALTFRTLRVILGKHNIHKTLRTSDQHHGCRLRAGGVAAARLILNEFIRQTRACRRHGGCSVW
ncbi:hypothetical protein LXL04_032835 [Taraxacum kok-saghyz]